MSAKSAKRKPLKILGLTLGFVLALLLLIVGGTLIWLRSSSGSGFVYDQVVKILKDQGLTLTADEFRGPLPNRLIMRGAVIADAEGPVARIGLLEVEIKPTALVSKLVHVPLLKIEEPVLVRMPVLPPSEKEEPSGPFRLPVDIRLDELTLTGGRVEAGALASLGLDFPALALSAGGLARLEGERSAIDLGAGLSEAGGDDLITAVIRLGAGERSADGSATLADRLEIALKVQDRPGGLLAGLLDDPDWPGLVLELDGQGRLDDWKGRLDLASGGLGEVTADLGFQGQSGNLWRDLVGQPGWNGRLALTAKPGLALGPVIRPWTGEEFKADIQGGLSGRAVRADLKLSPSGDFNGTVNLKAELDLPSPDEPASGRIKLSGRDLNWPAQILTGLLGPEFDLETVLSGGGGQPLTADIRQASAGQLSLAGQVGYLPGPTPAQNQVEADLKIDLNNLGSLSPDLSGPVTLSLTATGPLNDFKSQISLASPALKTAPGLIEDLSLKADLTGAVLTDSPPEAGPARDLKGHLELAAADSPGGPLELATDWTYRENGPELALTVANLAGQLAGLTLSGGLSADLGGERPGLAGDLSADIADWSKLAALTGQPLTGQAARLLINLGSAEGRQTASAKLDLPRLRLGSGAEETLSLNKTSLDFRAEDLFGRPDLELDLALGSGLAGPLSWASGSVTADGREGAGQFAVRLAQTKISGTKGAARDGLSVDGRFDLAGDQPVIDLEKFDFLLAQSGLSLKQPMTLTLGENLKISPFTASFRPAGQIAAEVDLTPGAMKIKADLQKLPYAFLKPFVGDQMPDGEIQSLTVALDQGADGLAGQFALKTQAAPTQLKNLKPTLSLDGRLSGGQAPALELEGAVAGGPGWKADGKFKANLPLTAGPDGGFPQPNMNGPLSGNLTFTGSLGPVWNLAGQPDRSLSGEAKIEAQVEGSLNDPKPRGTAYLAGGRFEDSIFGLLINDITLEAHSTPELPLKALLSAKDGRGGGLALEAELRDLNNPSLTADARLSRFSPIHRDDLIVFISGTVGAKGPLATLAVTSDLTVDRGELDFRLAMLSQSIPTLTISNQGDEVQSAGGGLDMNLKVRVPNQFFIRGFGLDSEWRGDLAIGGTSNRPSLVGQLVPVRGYYEFLSKEFEFTGGDISFNGGTNPNLNLELTNSGPNITAIIRALGTASKPRLVMESRPPLPQEEVLAQVLFGKNKASMSRFEAFQLAAAVNELANFGKGGGMDLVGRARAVTGFDVLRLGGTENTRERRASSLSGSMGQEMAGGSSQAGSAQSDDLSVEAGKYISDNIYVGVEHSGTGGSAVRLEVELKPSITFEARTSTESSQFGLGWKKDY